MAKMKVSGNSFDLRGYDRAIFEIAGDPHRPARVEREPSEVLIRYGDHLLLIVDEHKFRQRLDALEDAFAFGQFAGRRSHPMGAGAHAVRKLAAPYALDLLVLTQCRGNP